MRIWIVVEEWWNGSRYAIDPKEDISLFYNEADAREYADGFKNSAKNGDVIIYIQERVIE